MSQQTVQFLKISEVVDLSRRCRASIYKDISKGLFPAPVKLGARSSAWTAQSIAQWQQDCISQSAK
jgi:prophage regulatory protein